MNLLRLFRLYFVKGVFDLIYLLIVILIIIVFTFYSIYAIKVLCIFIVSFVSEEGLDPIFSSLEENDLCCSNKYCIYVVYVIIKGGFNFINLSIIIIIAILLLSSIHGIIMLYMVIVYFVTKGLDPIFGYLQGMDF